jgi:micrococcal nuclease
MLKRSWLLLVVLFVIPVCAFAQTFSGKCVGVTDGDTIGVLKDGKEIKIRFDGIDCPEMGQDFGNKAKRFTSDLVFGKVVEVRQKDIDKYGRTVARIIVDGKDVSLELVKAGLAWHYKQYSSDAELAGAETVARSNEDGLWAMKNPVAPWDFRHGTSTNSNTQTIQTNKSSDNSTTDDQKNITVYVTRTGKKYHSAGCRYLKSSIPMSLKDAIAAGYTACSVCGGGRK